MIDGTIIKGVSELLKSGFNLVDELHTSDEEKSEAKLKLQQMVLQHEQIMESTITQQIKSREAIIVAEMQNGDNFTKRARPAVIYTFLGIVVLNYCIFPTVGHFLKMPMPQLELPKEAWNFFTVAFSVYGVGRTWEKVKGAGGIVKSVKSLYNRGEK